MLAVSALSRVIELAKERSTVGVFVSCTRVAQVPGQRPAGLEHAYRGQLLVFVSVYEAKPG